MRVVIKKMLTLKNGITNYKLKNLIPKYENLQNRKQISHILP